ncbi:hypothetical protein ACFWVU_04390 [Streptomyces sp. NPDC058686]|uniref:hypothetical protein n=1 Tax=Streptomyces sp. NPDC058686 TaxID=3346599 RepID=UPI00365BE4CC
METPETSETSETPEAPKEPKGPRSKSRTTARTLRRLLPWAGADDKPCYLLTDRHTNGTSAVARLADNIESLQLGMGTELLGHARALLDEPRVDAQQLRFLSARLSEALQDALRVAESRGARLDLIADEHDDHDDVGAAEASILIASAREGTRGDLSRGDEEDR